MLYTFINMLGWLKSRKSLTHDMDQKFPEVALIKTHLVEN